MKLGLRNLLASASIVASMIGAARADPGSPPLPPGDPATPAAVRPEPTREVSAAAVPQPSPLATAVPAPTSEEIRRRRVAVKVDSTRPNTVLERRVSLKESVGAFIVIPFRSTDATWEQVCVTPCEIDLDRFSTYRIGAQNKVSGSSVFTLPQGSDALRLTVDSGSLFAHRLGQTMSVIGVSAMIVGGSLLVAASDFARPSSARIAGAITGGAGLAFAGVGIPLTVTTASHVDRDDGREVARIYGNRGYPMPFLPDIKLSKTFTLTQKGIVF